MQAQCACWVVTNDVKTGSSVLRSLDGSAAFEHAYESLRRMMRGSTVNKKLSCPSTNNVGN